MKTARDTFREAVFARDSQKCVICRVPAVDAHHIVERRLWAAPVAGGYILDNGVSVCELHHLLAESTELSCDALRAAAGISAVVLPDQFEPGEVIDKWGNPILPNGQRMRGELFEDESVQKVMAPVLHLFTRYVKAPRTYHLPWSQKVDDNDRRLLPHCNGLSGVLVVTEKMDGSSISIYRDHAHSRATEGIEPAIRSHVKSLQARIGHDIPDGWRVIGEAMWPNPVIPRLPYTTSRKSWRTPFLVHSVWNERNIALPWKETEEWAELLGLDTVPFIESGQADGPNGILATYEHGDGRRNPRTGRVATSSLEWPPWIGDDSEGYVIRFAGPIAYRDWRMSVGKFVKRAA